MIKKYSYDDYMDHYEKSQVSREYSKRIALQRAGRGPVDTRHPLLDRCLSDYAALLKSIEAVKND